MKSNFRNLNGGSPVLRTRLFGASALCMALALCATSGATAAVPGQDGLLLEQQAVQTIKGRVLSNTGEAVVGATVAVKGAKTRALTDADGSFAIKAQQGQTLVISCIGYKRTEQRVQGTQLAIEMQEMDNSLGEAVVIGYGTVKKADLAGSVSVMDAKSFKDQPVARIEDALQGRMAGVNVVSDGIPGGSVKIRVRGANSINKSNDPLYVVDGMVRESGLDGINPEDIQNLQVLKDASSTAIYGSRGANGVVIVTTKSGAKGRQQITFDASVGVSKATKLPEMMNTKDYANALVKYAGINQSNVQEFIDGTNPGIDWVDLMFRTGVTQNYKLVFTSGTEKLQSYISGSYLDHQGTMEGTQYQRYSAKVNVKAEMAPWLDVTFDLNASHGKGKGIGGLEMGGYNPLWIAFNSSPAMHMTDDQGNYIWDPYGTIQENAWGIVQAKKQERRRDVLTGHVDLKFKIIPGLTFTTSNGIDYHNGYGYNFTPAVVTDGKPNGMGNSNTQRTLLQSTNNLTYMGSWGKHSLTATGVWEATKSQTRGMSISGNSISPEVVGWWNIASAASRDGSNSYTDWSLLSAVARAMYNYDDRYMLTATFRADGSSRFSGTKWGYFPSFAAAWTVSNEKFMQPVKDILSNLKIRASWGIIGNQDITPYSTLALLSSLSVNYGSDKNGTGYWVNTLPTPDLKWEKTKQFDFGIDLGFLGNRLEVNFDAFAKKTSDALLSTSLADYLGGSTYYINAGEVANRGFDLGVTARVIQQKDWEWTTSLNGSFLKNEVKKLTAQQPILYDGSFQSIITDCTVTKEGEPLGAFYGYEWAGIDSEGYDTYYAADGSVTRKPGNDDRKILGKSIPDFTLGWNNTVRWKNLSLNAFFNASFGAKRLNALRFAMNSMIGNSRMFTDASFMGLVGTEMPDPSVADNQYLGNSTKWLENASYLRLENLTLAYDLEKSLTKFADLRLSLSVQNLFTIAGYKGSDPAGFAFGGNDRVNGIDTGAHPAPRTFTFGARFTF